MPNGCDLAGALARVLQEVLWPHVGLGKSRLETLCLLVVGMISARTVSLPYPPPRSA